MPLSDRYAASLFPPNANKTSVRARILTPLEALSLSSGLHSDCGDLYFSAWVSYLDAIRGIQSGFYTWAIIKLYYSVFYALRANLALSNFCIFHVQSTQYSIIAIAGSSPFSTNDRGTHKTVLNTFQRTYPAHPLVSQEIDLVDPFDWFIDKRETANYRTPRFSEPECDESLRSVVKDGLRKSLNAYISDRSLLYVFDPDHALLAYPLEALLMTGNQIVASGVSYTPSDDEQKFLRASARDKTGAITSLHNEMKRLGLI